jgi:hypothetical protein
MKKQYAFILAGLAIVTSSAAFGQSADVTYCKALAAKTTAVTRGGGTAPPAEIPVAISKCDSGDKGSIATLEKYLTDNKQALPAR